MRLVRISILGSSGFLGRNLCRRLVAEGHEVVGFALEVSNEDLGYERRRVSSLFDSPISRESIFDVTINLAARRSTKAFPLSTKQVDEFTFKIPREFILKTASEGTVILNASTYIQNFGGIEGKTTDSYAEAKERLSKFLEMESPSRGFCTIDLFFFTIYGPGDKSAHLVPLLLEAARLGSRIELSPGFQLMNLLYVEDAVENIFNWIAPSMRVPYTKNYLWSTDYFTVRELVERMEIVIGQKINCNWGGREYAGHEMMEPWPIPMQKLPGFTVTTSLEIGIENTWNHMSQEY